MEVVWIKMLVVGLGERAAFRMCFGEKVTRLG